MTTDVGTAYSATGAAWQAGPGRIYDRLAELLVDTCPGGVAGRRVLDVGAGTGAASRAADRAGAAAVVAVDIAAGMLDGWTGPRPPAAVGDARLLPFRADSIEAVVAAFSLNHVPDPAVALADAARVLAPGGGLAASAYSVDDTHPVKSVVEGVLTERGWAPAGWYEHVRSDTVPLLATTDRAHAAADEAGLVGSEARRLDVPFPHLTPIELVEWRLGMAATAPFVAGLTASDRAAVVADALDRLGPDPEPLVRRIVILTWQAPS